MASFEPGLHKTSKFLPGHEAEIQPDMLVLIRTDGEFAPASVLKPVRNEHNGWRFAMPGYKVPATAMNWASTLVKVPPEGFYRLTREFTFGEGGRYTANAIVQLGYTSQAEPILFIATRRSPLLANDLWFSDRGVKITLEQANTMLDRLNLLIEPERAS